MRMPVAVLILALAAACAREPDDGNASFQMEIEAPASDVLLGLQEFDGGTMPRLLGLRPIGVSSAGNGKVHVSISGEGSQSGKILFDVKSVGKGASLVTVNIDLPGTIRVKDGREINVYGSEAADTLDGELEDWAKSMEKGDASRYDTGGVNQALTAIAMRLSPTRTAQLREVASNGDVWEYARTQAEFHGSDVPGLGGNREKDPEGFARKPKKHEGWAAKPIHRDGWADDRDGGDWAY